MPKALLVGWDGAGWNGIHPLLDAGAMPNLARVVERGVMGDLATLTPPVTPLLWTSLATGVYADVHGVLDSVEADPRTGGTRAVTRASLQSLQIWDLLAREGLRAQVIGWPATHPATASQSACISDAFAFGAHESIHPAELAPQIATLRFSPQEWTGADLKLFVPELASIDQDHDKRLARLAVILAEAVSVHAAATRLLESQSADFTAVCFSAMGRAAALFPADTDEVYREVLSGVYRFLDLLLGRLIQLNGDDALVMLVSAYDADGAKLKGGPRGLLCAAGPGVEPDELTFGAGILDIAPTILGWFGFTTPRSMPGRAIPEIRAQIELRELQTVDSAATCRITEEPHLDLSELDKLDYADPVADASRPMAEAAARRRELNRAQVLMTQGRAVEAIAPLEALSAAEPENVPVRIYLAHAYYHAGRLAQCSALSEALIAEKPDSPLAPLARAHLAIAAGNLAEAREYLRFGRGAEGVAANLQAAMGEAYLRMGSSKDAIEAFGAALGSDARLAVAHEGLAHALLLAGRHSEATEAALDAIRLHFDSARAHRCLALALKALGRNEEAATALALSERLSRRVIAS